MIQEEMGVNRDEARSQNGISGTIDVVVVIVVVVLSSKTELSLYCIVIIISILL